MAHITVYTTPGCIQCGAVTRHLAKRGADFKEINMADDDQARQMVMDAGFRQAPVVDLGDGSEMFSGYRPDKLDQALSAEVTA